VLRAGSAPRRRKRCRAIRRAEDAGRPHAARVGTGRAGAPGHALAHALAPHMPQGAGGGRVSTHVLNLIGNRACDMECEDAAVGSGLAWRRPHVQAGPHGT
jgi:hypothetical protein